ncbi:MAG TPA: formimidoylglutamate deiminase [Candidatus Nanopelagicaceae bacterium]|nr:formimidoylglutamate deiminase [Candidatus Nanopelagicaceae bacterium]
MASFLLELAWTGDRLQRRLLLEEVAGTITRLEPLGAGPAPPEAVVMPGLTLPGLSNVHSHAFHRALRGRTEEPAGDEGDFWSWRAEMYRLAGRLEPTSYFQLARAAFAEMALAGITAVGEFHYLHHQAGGQPYPGPAMEEALVAAAAEAGVRLTLLDSCYLRPGFQGGPLDGPATRFADRDALAWARRVDSFPERPGLRRAAAIHSVRALDQAAIRIVSGWAREHSAPLHVHVSEQLAENLACEAATGMTPTALLHSLEVLGPTTTAIHAIHLSPEDVRLLGETSTTVCVCPTTERDLGDGVCPAAALAGAGSPLCLGSDSNAVVDLFEEARAVELDQRLVTHRRGVHAATSLLWAATGAGSASLGWNAGELAVGRLADFVSLELETPRLAGPGELDLISRVVYAAAPSDIREVVVGGRPIVSGGRHLRLGAVGSLLTQVISDLEAP